MGARPVPRRQEVVVVTELELRMQLLGGGGNCYNINDNADLLAEILARLDGRSLAAAACVCRLWAAVARRDAVWEALCLRHVGPASGPTAGPATRAVVAALGGYRRLYRLCLGPALDRLGRGGGAIAHAHARARLSLSLSLSLFSIDCYERLGGGGAGRQPQPSSLLFLCKPVDVS
uniref:F-box domain-containing protein n=1 Tax=Oryza punctata TaxID=4537 RepID=A0A0E0KA13_ORYPU